MVDRGRAKRALAEYLGGYDLANPRIALKAEHTARVAALCDRIARGVGLPREDVDVAWLIGLLHDIGRFEQIRRFDTFNDARSVDHAALGGSVLFDTEGREAPLIRAFVGDEGLDRLIRTAVITHSAYRLPDGMDERTRAFCDILRDADKIDIIRVNCECPIRDVYGVTEREMADSALSAACVELFYQHQCLPSGMRRYPADVMLGHICFVWELVFDCSVEIMREQGYLAQMLSRTWSDPDTQNAFSAMATHLIGELGW